MKKEMNELSKLLTDLITVVGVLAVVLGVFIGENVVEMKHMLKLNIPGYAVVLGIFVAYSTSYISYMRAKTLRAKMISFVLTVLVLGVTIGASIAAITYGV